MFLMLLALGAGNFFLVERLRAQPTTPVLRLKRFAEVEVGIGIAQLRLDRSMVWPSTLVPASYGTQ